MKLSGKSVHWLGIFLCGALLLAPGAAWATGEDLQEADSKTAKKDESDPDATDETDKKKASGKASPEAAAKLTDPSFNTLEDIAPMSGPLALLWASPSEAKSPKTTIEWRSVPQEEPPAPRPAPLNSTKAR